MVLYMIYKIALFSVFPESSGQLLNCSPYSFFHDWNNCWTEHYYVPQAGVQEEFLRKYAGDRSVERFVAFARQEAELYRKYKEFYGYVFYIGKKI